VPLHTPDKHLICHWWCGPCNCSRADSDRNATGQAWYGLTKGADFREVRYQVVKLQGLCLVQNSLLHRWLLGCEGCVSSHGKYLHLWCLPLSVCHCTHLSPTRCRSVKHAVCLSLYSPFSYQVPVRQTCCLSDCLSVCMSVCQTVCLSVTELTFLQPGAGLSMSNTLSVCLWVWMSVSLSVYACLYVCMYVCMYVCLSLYSPFYSQVPVCQTLWPVLHRWLSSAKVLSATCQQSTHCLATSVTTNNQYISFLLMKLLCVFLQPGSHNNCHRSVQSAVNYKNRTIIINMTSIGNEWMNEWMNEPINQSRFIVALA